MLTLLLVSMLTLTFNVQLVKAQPKTIVVPDDYPTIQEAINAATPSDTIIVRDGTYIENVDVNKSLTIKSENGADSTIVQATNFDDYVFEVTADYVKIQGFTAKGATGSYKAGICLHFVDYCDISHNHASNNLVGIYLGSSTNNTITNNTCSNNSADGIFLRYSYDRGAGYNMIINNTCLNNGNDGIELEDSNYNTITDNTVSNNGFGITLSSSSGNHIEHNTANNNERGISLGSSYGNTITNNNCSSNEEGISLAYSGNNNILSNSLNSHLLGIYLIGSRNHVVTDNRFENCGILIGAGLEHELSCYNTHMIEGNTINGKPIYYYKDASGIRVPEDAGEVILANCNNVTIENIDASAGSVGIELAYTANSTISSNMIFSNNLYGIDLEDSNGDTIKNNNFSNNEWGIFLRFSSDNSITGNTVSNNYKGIDLVYSSNNEIYYNNFLDNGAQVHSYYCTNVWDDGYPSGGNYWSDYTDVDLYSGPYQNETGSDGIWDHPYVTDENNQDRYPLINPWTPTPPPPENQPPTCVVKLQKDGVEISEVDVEEFFDVYVGDSTDDTGIKQVRFSSDDYQDNNPTGTWTQWYDWGASSEDWNASTKIKRWSFTTPGYKEVWAEVKDDINQTAKRLARIYVPGSQLPFCVVELQKEGIKIDHIDAGQAFDIYVGDSTDDAAIVQVMFSADDSQDGVPTGEWTYWYDWNQHSGNWSALDKTMKWSFAIGGKKEVWAMIKDSDGNVVWNYSNIFVHPGYAIIVAGEGGWREKWGIDYAANNAYRSLRNLGFDDDHIFYLNSKRPQDMDGDGLDEVDAPASFSYFENTIHDVKNKIGDNPTPFVLYLTGHGDLDANNFVCFIFNDYYAPEEGYLWDSDLKRMLSEFPSETPMLIVIGSCYSGRFITSDESISALNRIIITATHDDQERNYLGWLRSSDRFWGNLDNGLSVKEAFTAYALIGDNRNLWLDDNGDRIGHPPDNLGNDGELAATTHIGRPHTESLTFTPWQYIVFSSPGEIRVYDSQNRVTGIVNREIKEEIPNSIFDEENRIVAIFCPFDTYRYEVVGTETGTYGLNIAFIEDGEATTFAAIDIPTSVNATHQYTVDWVALSQSKEGVTVQVDSEGDGVFEHTFTSDSELTQSEFLAQTAPPPLSVSISPLSASILVGQSVTFAPTVSGGYTPYNYQWYLNDNPVSGVTSNTWTFTPTTSGIYYVYLKVTDDKANTAQSETARIVVATVPVGGYSIPIQLPATAKPVTIHIALLTILTAIFTTIKRKTKRKHKNSTF